jgi:hypothetical protein
LFFFFLKKKCSVFSVFIANSIHLLPVTSYIDHQPNQWQGLPSLPKVKYQQEHHQELDGRILRDL